MFPTAAQGPHIAMRRAPHLPRMSRIAAVLLPLHTASLLPLGTRVASLDVALWLRPSGCRGHRVIRPQNLSAASSASRPHFENA